MSDRSTARRVGAGVAALAALAALAWFARAVGPDLSVTVQSALLALGAAVTLVGAATLRYREGLTFLFAVLLVAAAGYATSTHSLGVVGVVATILATLAIAAGAVYLVVDRRYRLRRREALAALAVVALVGAALVGADLRTDPLSYETSVHDAADVPAEPEGTEPVVVGTATARNDFAFREQLAFPPARACVFNGTTRTNVPVLYGTNGSYFPSSVGGHGELAAEMTVLVPPAVVRSLNGTVPVERASSCPDSSDEARIVIVFEE